MLTRKNSKGKKLRRVIYVPDEALEIIRRRMGFSPISANTRGNAYGLCDVLSISGSAEEDGHTSGLFI